MASPAYAPAAAAASPSGAALRLVEQIAATTTRPWTLMEVCGGQTHAILRWGLDQLLPAPLRLIHGPGCPVCVTPEATLDAAIALAGQPGVILAPYGDMLRVPGSNGSSLLSARAAGGDVRVITAAGQALEPAQRHPGRQVVLLAVGFETTAPATALLALQTLALGLANLSILSAHVRVVPAMEALWPSGLRPRRAPCRASWPRATWPRRPAPAPCSDWWRGGSGQWWCAASAPRSCCGPCWPTPMPPLHDAARLTLHHGRLAFSTDGTVVQPLVFPAATPAGWR